MLLINEAGRSVVAYVDQRHDHFSVGRVLGKVL